MAVTDTESSLLKGMHSDASVGFENDGFSSEAIIIFFLLTNEHENDLKTVVRNHWTFHLQSARMNFWKGYIYRPWMTARPQFSKLTRNSRQYWYWRHNGALS